MRQDDDKMIKLNGNKIRDMEQLTDEIIEAFPELKEIMVIYGNPTPETSYKIMLPDRFDSQLIQTIIDNHVPKAKVKKKLSKQQFLDELVLEFANKKEVEII